MKAISTMMWLLASTILALILIALIILKQSLICYVKVLGISSKYFNLLHLAHQIGNDRLQSPTLQYTIPQWVDAIEPISEQTVEVWILWWILRYAFLIFALCCMSHKQSWAMLITCYLFVHYCYVVTYDPSSYHKFNWTVCIHNYLLSGVNPFEVSQWPCGFRS